MYDIDALARSIVDFAWFMLFIRLCYYIWFICSISRVKSSLDDIKNLLEDTKKNQKPKQRLDE